MNQSALFEYFKNTPIPNLADIIVVSDENEAKKAEAIALFSGMKVYTLPDLRLSPGEDSRSFLPEIRECFLKLARFSAAGDKAILISPLRTMGIPLPIPEYIKYQIIEFAQNLERDSFKEKLFYWGYNFVDLVTEEGEVSVRGDIIDIFPVGSKSPYRISLFDEEIEEIRCFDPSTQKREKDEIESFELWPAFLSLEKETYNALQNRVERSPYESSLIDNDVRIDRHTHRQHDPCHPRQCQGRPEHRHHRQNQKEVPDQGNIGDQPGITVVKDHKENHQDKAKSQGHRTGLDTVSTQAGTDAALFHHKNRSQ